VKTNSDLELDEVHYEKLYKIIPESNKLNWKIIPGQPHLTIFWI